PQAVRNDGERKDAWQPVIARVYPKQSNVPRRRGHLSGSCSKSNSFFAAQHTDYKSVRAVENTYKKISRKI
ncbi:MAG: hypothetical protein LBL79_04165, partial [Prevotella sp.]|nr:hypothetical protein [Prevotella sp.]